MNLRTTLILFGLLAVGLGTFALFQLLGVKTAKERESGGKYVLASLNDESKPIKATEFDTLTLERPNPETKQPEKLEFKRENSQWKLVAPKAVRVDDSAVTTLANQVMGLQKEKTKLKDGLESYGLDKPSTVVTLTKGKESWKLHVGKQGPDAADPLHYVAGSDDPKTPHAVKKSRFDKLFAPLGDFRDKRIFTTSFGVNELTLAGKERAKLQLAKQGETQWRFKEPALGEADLSSVNAVNLDLTGLRVEKNADYLQDGKPDAETLKKYGLTPEDAAYVVSISHSAMGDPAKATTETLLVGKPDPSVAAALDAERAGSLIASVIGGNSGLFALGSAATLADAKSRPEAAAGARYAMKVGEDTIFRLGDKSVAALAKSANDFRVKTLASLDATKLDAINLTAGSETLRLRRQTLKPDASAAADWQLFTDSRAKVAAQGGQVQKLIDALNRVTAKDASAFLDDDAAQRKWFGADAVDLGLDKPHAEIQLWLEGLERGADGKLAADKEPAFKEAAKGKPSAKFFIGRRDPKRSVVYVRRELPDQQPVILALPDPWSQQAPNLGGELPEGRQSYSLSELSGAGYLAYRDRSLPSLRQFDAAKLEVVRPSGAFELVKEEKKDDKGAVIPSWTIKKPVEAKSPLAEMLVNGLVSIGADQLVTDRPTERDLEEKFGVGQKPFMKFVLTGKPNADQKADVYEYLVGKKTEADGKTPDRFYARLIAKPAAGPAPESNQFVFLLTPQQVQQFDLELRDSIVFPFDSTLKPQGLTLTWNGIDAAKKPTQSKLELALAEDKKSWFVKSLTIDGKDEKAKLPKLDQQKIEVLVGTVSQRNAALTGSRLNPLVAERFLADPPAPAMRLDPASKDGAPALIAELKFDGGSQRTLIVGEPFEPKEAEFPGLAGRACRYATASSAPNVVFLLGQQELKDLLSGPQFFKPPDVSLGQ